MDLKSCAYRQCRILLDEQIQTLSRTLEDLKESISAETKSSAGDKHETARAHLQAAQEQAGRQLAAALAQKAALDGIDIRQTAVRISRGSLIKTSEGCLLMSVALGKMRCGRNIRHSAFPAIARWA